MKNLRIRVTLALTLLIALGAVFGVATAPSAHAASTRTTPAVRIVPAVAIAPSAHTASAAVKPNTNGVGCGDPQFFTIFSLIPAPRGGYYQVEHCYANGGDPIGVYIPLAFEICTGYNSGLVLVPADNVWYNMPAHNTCYGFNYVTITAIKIY